ncbi:MAG: DUF2849 domain-containing protein [Alphaproteobacteria bacterium]|nr:MAG: DUF2849 domain-containing protein [Alphaproteobacteria bacterium]
MTHQMVTSNRLSDGEVVYLTSAGHWSERLEDGAVTDDAEAAARHLATAQQLPEHMVQVVDPYLMKVTAQGDRILPISQREIIRAKGPTTHLHFGKQADRDSNHV